MSKFKFTRTDMKRGTFYKNESWGGNGKWMAQSDLITLKPEMITAFARGKGFNQFPGHAFEEKENGPNVRSAIEAAEKNTFPINYTGFDYTYNSDDTISLFASESFDYVACIPEHLAKVILNVKNVHCKSAGLEKSLLFYKHDKLIAIIMPMADDPFERNEVIDIIKGLYQFSIKGAK